MIRCVGLQHDVATAPRLIVDQSPVVRGAGRVGRHQEFAWTDDAFFAVTRGKFERAGERDDILPLGRLVPVKPNAAAIS